MPEDGSKVSVDCERSEHGFCDGTLRGSSQGRAADVEGACACPCHAEGNPTV